MTPLEFLNALWQYKPEDQHILIWTLPEKRSRWFTSVPAAAEYVTALKKCDVYVGIGLAGKDYGPAHRCVSDQITGIAGIGADFDLASEAHSKKALPKTVQQAASIIPPAFAPTIIVATGNGVHVWWLFKEPYIFESDEERNEVQRVVARFHTMVRLNAAKFGWDYDRLSDLARVLRVPGTRNYKDPANPKPVVVLSHSDRRYNLSDIEELLDEAGIPDPEAQERAAREWAERFADKPLTIDLSARIPDETLNAWMTHDMRFRNTWLRQRHDLKDQSQSGYDLALACFGIDAGLAEQRIVDLIVHHRTIHGNRHRTRLDYFQRTIAKAYRRVGEPLTVPATPAPGSSAAGATAAPCAQPGAQGAPEDAVPPKATTPDPETQKLALCEQISAVLGIRVVRLVKYTGKEPTYLMYLGDGGKIEFPHVGKLISQDAVRVAIAATAGKIIRKIKPKEWDPLAQMLLDACIVEQGPEEMDFEGAARMYVMQYLQETGRIETIEGQTVQNSRRPMIIDGKITICTSDLQTYVNRTTFQNLSIKAIAALLGALGAKGMRVRGAKFKEQSRWALPVDEFDPREYYPEYREAMEAKNAAE
jgi:hypothetical protein